MLTGEEIKEHGLNWVEIFVNQARLCWKPQNEGCEEILRYNSVLCGGRPYRNYNPIRRKGTTSMLVELPAREPSLYDGSIKQATQLTSRSFATIPFPLCR